MSKYYIRLVYIDYFSAANCLKEKEIINYYRRFNYCLKCTCVRMEKIGKIEMPRGAYQD